METAGREAMASLTALEKRMAWHGGLLRRGRLTVSAEELEQWRKGLPQWTEREYERMTRGELTERPTFKTVMRMVNSEKDG